jgi:hypothetical protein
LTIETDGTVPHVKIVGVAVAVCNHTLVQLVLSTHIVEAPDFNNMRLVAVQSTAQTLIPFKKAFCGLVLGNDYAAVAQSGTH